MLISVDPEYPNLKRVANAARIVREGGLLAYPTDTTYGIGADPFQPKAVAELFNETQRSPKKPASLLCADLKMIGQYAVISDRVFKIMKRTLPGPYTLILPAKSTVPKSMHGKRREVGIRVPAHPIVQALIAAIGTPILNLSARNAEGFYLDNAREIEAHWGYRISAILDCGPITPEESTVIDLVEDQAVLIREGMGDPAPFVS